jgi:hypothetical protein
MLVHRSPIRFSKTHNNTITHAHNHSRSQALGNSSDVGIGGTYVRKGSCSCCAVARLCPYSTTSRERESALSSIERDLLNLKATVELASECFYVPVDMYSDCTEHAIIAS